MNRRALLIGSQTGALRGVHQDVTDMRDTLAAFGFTATVVTGAAATAAGIRAAFWELLEHTAADDATVVYYSGHGARLRTPEGRWLQYLVPVDFGAAGTDFRGILAEELSLLQAELTARTANVTTILDCCHAARMSRDPTALPKAPLRPAAVPWHAVAARLNALHPRLSGGESNPSAVRLVACGSDASAYELPPGTATTARGALTAALTDLLRQPGSATLSWRELVDLLRTRITGQRPDVEGPADRHLFRTTEKSSAGVLPVRTDAGPGYLDHADLHGITAGDRYALVPIGGDAQQPVAVCTVARITAGRAWFDRSLPHQLEAHPLAMAAGQLPVALHPPEHPDHAHVFDALTRARHVRVARPGDRPLATVRLHARTITLLDAGGDPLTEGPLTGTSIRRVVADLLHLARAAHVRHLPSGRGGAHLRNPVTVEPTLLTGGAEHALDPDGVHLFVGDHVVLRLHNRAGERRYVTVFDVGLRGAVTRLTTSARAGLSLEDGDTYELYRMPVTNALAGIELYWPDRLPATGPRPATFVVVTTDRPHDLSALVQPDLRDLRPHAAVGLRYHVRRLDFMLHPGPRPPAEPTFAVDDRPHLSTRLTPPRSTAPAHARVAVRLTRLVAAGTVRLHCLAVTRSADRRRVIHRLTTVPLDGRLTPPGVPLYTGDATDVLDLAIWASPTPRHVPEPAPDDAATTLAYVTTVAGMTLAVAHALPDAIAVYRGTLLAADHFGAGTTTARQAGGVSFAVVAA